MIILYTYICWCLYASLEGWREARYFYYKNKANLSDSFNDHALFTIQRIFVWVTFLRMMFDINNYFTLLNGLFLAFSFTFFHDGFYYEFRNKLDNSYSEGFLSQSTNSTSWFDKLGFTKPVYRCIYMIVSIIGLIIINYAKYY